MRKILLVAVMGGFAIGGLVGGCGDLAVYEGADAERDGAAADGMRADGVGGDGVSGDAVSADAADGAVDTGGDVVADTVTDAAVDSAGDAAADAEQDAAPDVFMCPTGTNTCVLGGPCVAPGTTNESCGSCPAVACGPGFSCMSPSMSPLDQECCYAVDRANCGSQCTSPAGCLYLPNGSTFCCQNN